MRCCAVLIKEELLPRGKSVHILLDISQPNVRERYVVLALLDRKEVLGMIDRVTYERAVELFDAEVLLPGPRGDSSLRSVLDRCMEKRGGIPGRWEGSIGEYASRFYAIGTWDWVQSLVEYRQRCENEREKAA